MSIKSGYCGCFGHEHEVSWSLKEVTKRGSTKKVLTIAGRGQMEDFWSSDDELEKNVDEVIIKEGITKIGRCAFQNWSMTKVSIPDSVSEIGEYAFGHCPNLTKVTISRFVKIIAPDALQSCPRLEEINVDQENSNYISIDGVLFNKDATELIQFPCGKKSTSHYNIPNGTVIIRDFAFKEASELVTVAIPESVINVGRGTFNYCPKLEYIMVHVNNMNYCGSNGVLYTKGMGTLIQYPTKKKANYRIPDGTTTIEPHAFAGSDSLISVEISKTVTLIKPYAFSECINLREFYVDPLNTKYMSDNGVLFSKNMHILIQYPIGREAICYDIPKGVAVVNKGAFSKAVNLLAVVMPSSISKIEEFAFKDCIKLQSASISENTKEIGMEAFAGCIGLTSVIFVESTTTSLILDDRAFAGCKGLTWIILHKKFRWISKNSFEGCENLTNIYYEGNLEQFGKASPGHPILLGVPDAITIHFGWRWDKGM